MTESELRVVGPLDRLFESAHPPDREGRSKHFLDFHRAASRRVDNHGREIEKPPASAGSSGSDRRRSGRRRGTAFATPGRPPHRAGPGCAADQVASPARHQGQLRAAGLLSDRRNDLVGDRLIDIDAFHREAGLAAVVVAAPSPPRWLPRAKSASSQMIIGSDPPSSSVTRLVPLAASAAICSPTGVEPVNATLRTSGC